ncbi:MAG: NADH-quinone oxidoreductase subunit NuoK [Elusimicrobia bacterium]|nr:NADH-quinone oxidoreductase subunit NuoK [Elusimicrobiota bacterium]
MTISSAVWTIAGTLFALGLAMLVLRRGLLAMFLGVELMLAAANLAVVRQAGLRADAQAQAAVALILAVAAAEAVVGLSLILRAFRAGRGLDAGAMSELRG